MLEVRIAYISPVAIVTIFCRDWLGNADRSFAPRVFPKFERLVCPASGVQDTEGYVGNVPPINAGETATAVNPSFEIDSESKRLDR